MSTISVQTSGTILPTGVTLVSLQNKADMSSLTFGSGVFTTAGGGIWSYTFDDPAPNLSYIYKYRVSLPNGRAMTYQGILNAGNLPTSPWFTYSDFVRKYGVKNVMVATNKDKLSNPNAATVPDFILLQDAFDSGFEEVCDLLRGGVWKVPLDFSPNSGNVPKLIRNAAMECAFRYITDDRGIEEKGNRFDTRLDRMAQSTISRLKMVKDGVIQILAVPATGMGAEAVPNLSLHGWSRFPWVVSGYWLPILDAAPIWIGACNGIYPFDLC